MSESEISEKPVFKRKRRKNIEIRKREEFDIDNDNDNEISELKAKVIDTKLLQKLRGKCNGLTLEELNEGGVATDYSTPDNDSHKLESIGGLIDMPDINGKDGSLINECDGGIGTKFSAETNKRDEDDDMMKYIEEQLRKRKTQDSNNIVSGATRNVMTNKHAKLTGNDNVSDGDDFNFSKRDPTVLSKPNTKDELTSFEAAVLQSASNSLPIVASSCSEEMLSNQMLNGIPEVELGIEAKIKNIEATEVAKLELIMESHKKKEAPSQFVPSNMAVNFVQHNRFSMEESAMSINEEKNRLLQKRGIYVRAGLNQNATDDYHYEKFKKQFRRY